MSNKKVCVIGAGVSGLVICKYLKESHISFDCYDKSEFPGGLWNIKNGIIYDSLHINTPKSVTEFEDFKLPDKYPEFCSHREILHYLEMYAKEHRLNEHIFYNTEVLEILEKSNREYLVKLHNGKEKIYSYVIIATGHHWNSFIPDGIKEKFSETFLHSSEYRSAERFKGKNVLVIGIGNSAVDIACDLAKCTNNSVTISTRNSTYIYPHYFLGSPLGKISNRSIISIPKPIKRWIGHIVLRIATGNQQKLGIPKPTFKLLDHHSTVSSDIFLLLGKGKIHFKQGISKIHKNEITFSDESKDIFDAIIACTGYRISVPFLPQDILNHENLNFNNRLNLYKRIILPDHPNIMFVGFVQPNYSIFRTAEEQAKWIVALLNNKFKLPKKEVMNKEIEKHIQYIDSNFYESPRHSIQVDFMKYSKSLKRDYLH